MSAITYTDAGHCTRCGSTGTYLQRDRSGLRIVPCPCHGWRPIETAPRDGTRVLLGTPGRSLSVEIARHEVDKWIGDDSWHISAATHWQPLPQAPEVGT